MKKNFTVLFLSLAILVSNTTSLKAQVNVQDSLALVDLYNNTDGPHWINNTNWLTAAPVTTWDGVSVVGNRVKYLFLYNNQLNGTIPATLANLGGLVYLYLNNNQLSGIIPASLGNFEKLTDLALSNNQLTGNIPSQLGNVKNLKFLYIDHNQISDTIPAALGRLENLEELYLDHNQLSGTIPDTLGNLKNLYTLYLNNNQLSGKLSPGLGNLTSLTYLYLNNNQLSGSIPAELNNLKKLIVLGLNNNLFTGNLNKLGKFNNLSYLNLSYNKLTGRLPERIGNCGKLQILNLSYNNALSGTIPSSFSNLISLKKLSLNHDRIEGPLPSFLGSLPKLDTLEILNNNFNFDGIEVLAGQGIYRFRYKSQKKIQLHSANNTLSVYAGGTLSNNTYKWFKDGILTATINGDSTYTPTSSGAYTVQVTNSVATELTLYSDTVTFSALTASQQNNIAPIQTSNKNNFSLYPNPAKTNTTITFNTTGNCIIKITDVSGRMLQTKTITAVKGRSTLQLDVSRYPAGLYFVTLSNAKNETQTVRFSKE